MEQALAIKKRIDDWLSGPVDEKTKEEIRRLQRDNPQGLIDAFFSDLTFGTGGLRELMGPGTCRINVYTIRQASQGLANYLRKEVRNKPLSIVIGFDSRHHSKEFAEEAAKVFAANGIHVYLLNELRPTPYVSFACRFKKADAAVMITASHNPKEYNGYKVYWSDGAQVVAPHDVGIVKEVAALNDFANVHVAERSNPLIETVDCAQTLDGEYLKAIAPLQHFPKENAEEGKSLKIVYTSLHGTGITMTPKALINWGFNNIHYVDAQIKCDPEFPTVKFPNPEYKEALQMGIDLLQSAQADLLIANDPDADRIGIVAMHAGQPVLFNGNEMAAICVEYLCQVMQNMPAKGTFVTTIVTTELIKAIAEKWGKICCEVLTGFKYIGEKIHEWENQKDSNVFIFGAEESYGYLLGTHARDKDAIIASCLIAEIALYAKRQNKTLKDLLDALYQKYGVYREQQLSIGFEPGQKGMEQMKTLMNRLRTQPHPKLLGIPVVYTEDYQTRKRVDAAGKTHPLDLPISNVLLYRLNDESRLVIRPSGTEPKLKIYASVHAKSIEEGDQKLTFLLNGLKKELMNLS